jgi:citrate lyase gamma subunit
MKMNTGAWIGIIGGAIGFLAAIAAVIVTTGSAGIYITVGMLALFGGMGYLFYKLFFGPMINANRLQKTGLTGTAKILEVKDTGVTINNNPQVKLTVEIKNSFGQRYTTAIKTLVSRINPFVYQPGMEVPVKIDPKNEQNVVIDYTRQQQSQPTTSFSQPDADVVKAELEQMQKEHEAISLSGRPAKAIIKKYTWLGINVNGNNPYAELEVQVIPESSPSFSGKTRGVIAASSVNKYQPGCEIFVKYDYYDNSKIAIAHS